MADCVSEVLDPTLLSSMLMKAKKPIVLKNMLKSWTGVPRTLDDLADQCGSTALKFRVVTSASHEDKTEPHIGSMNSKSEVDTEELCEECCRQMKSGPIWEAEGQSVKTKVSNFVEWVKGELPLDPDDNPLSVYDLQSHWVYSSYNYMKTCFPESSSLMQAIDWSPLGFPGRSGKESTLWLGSAGAYTPCHIDTYGYNLVAQIIGKKQWILFPPEDSSKLYLSRIPYEESSIFSIVDIANPNLHNFPWFKFTHPHVVTLEPGDVLCVPNKWWHHVTALETSLSINTWIELEEDHEARLEEAIVKAMMSIMVPMCDVNPNEFCWVNPGEELVESASDIEHLVKTALNKYMRQFKMVSSSNASDADSSEEDDRTDVRKSSINIPARAFENVIPVPELKFEDFFQKCCRKGTKNFNLVELEEAPPIPPDPIQLKSIVNCFVHPDVVSCIAQKLMELANSSLYCSI